jgi:hypothetical protein
MARTKLARALTRQQQKDQMRYWRSAQLQATNQDELNEATEQLNALLDEWVPEQAGQR